jgi:multicomponent Na+:H+ antiporter subunit F
MNYLIDLCRDPAFHEAFVNVVFLVLLGCCSLCLCRMAMGPTAPDRAVALDILGVVIVAYCALLSVLTGKDFYMSVAISWALLSYMGNIALAKYLEGKQFDE